MASPKIVRRVAPAIFASYLVNNDASGLDQDEIDLADEWLAEIGLTIAQCADADEEFACGRWYFDGGFEEHDMARYTFLVDR